MWKRTGWTTGVEAWREVFRLLVKGRERRVGVEVWRELFGLLGQIGGRRVGVGWM